jgi:hypothetical protein
MNATVTSSLTLAREILRMSAALWDNCTGAAEDSSATTESAHHVQMAKVARTATAVEKHRVLITSVFPDNATLHELQAVVKFNVLRQQIAQGVSITLPTKIPDAIASVVCLEVK